jgi:predicted GTPase
MSENNKYNQRLEKVISKRNALEKFAQKHPDELNDAFQLAISNVDLESESTIRADFEKNVNGNRDLEIGFVGRVKAGKSSILNALFFEGKSVLPKAAIPTTAALTILSYSETPKAKIVFIEEDDIERIKHNAEEYEKMYSKEVELQLANMREMAQKAHRPFDEVERRARAESAAKQMFNRPEYTNLSGCFDQYQRIKSAPNNVREEVRKCKEVELNQVNLDSLKADLNNYVGPEGRYTPFTQSVEISIPRKELKGLRIYDTPGFNDPVPSRTNCVRRFLKNCDVLFILSQSSQFLDESDGDVIRQVTQNEGSRQIYLLASQVDSNIQGDEYRECQGHLDRGLQKQKDSLKTKIQEFFSNKSLNYDGIFNQLLFDTDNRFVLTAGDCYSMYLTYEQKSEWDDSFHTYLDNLIDFYGEDFKENDPETTKESLKRISGIEKLWGFIEDARAKKAETLQASGEKVCARLEKAVDTVKNNLEKSLKRQLIELEQGEKEELEEKCRGLDAFCNKLEPSLARRINEFMADWADDNIRNMQMLAQTIINEADGKLADAKGHYTEVEEDEVGFFFTKTVYHTIHYTAVNCSYICSCIDDMATKLNISLKLEISRIFEQLKRELGRIAYSVWREKAADKDLDEDVVRNRVRVAIEKLKLERFSLPEVKIPSELASSGMARDQDGEMMLGEGKRCMARNSGLLQEFFIDTIKGYVESIRDSDLASAILSNYKKELQMLNRKLQDRDNSILEMKDIISELRAMP